MHMFHCINCDSHTSADLLVLLPGGLRVHRCGHIPHRLTKGESFAFAALVSGHQQPSLQCVPKRRRG
jgi:hypothetical protein